MKRALILLLLLAGCGSATPQAVQLASPPPASAPPVTVAATPTATATSAPTSTPRPTATRQPTVTATPEPTATSEPTATAEPTPEALRYVFPIEGAKVWYPATHHDYPAADMFCASGSRFVAPVRGVVDFVSREDLYERGSDRPEDRSGLAVAIIGDDGVRYYGSHLSAIADGIAPGVRVKTGQLLGLTGDTGNAKGTDPHLHFGISRPTTPDDWQVRRGEVAPYKYLEAWNRGDNVTPQVP